MKEPRKQHLSEAVAGVISKIVEMMLGLLRARGLRGLLELPTLFLFVRDLRRLAKEFATLFEAFKAGTRTQVAPEPEPEPQEWQPAPARPAAMPRRANRARAPARVARPRPALPTIARIPRRFPRVPVANASPRRLPTSSLVNYTNGPRKNPS
jgi:hypothetical protein